MIKPLHGRVHFKKLIFVLPILLAIVNLSAQTESVYLHFDKTICYPGDTVYFRGSIFENDLPSHLSTNLYVEIYNDSNQLTARKVFPILSSVSIGQIELPKSPGLYWVRSYTRNSAFFLRSLTVRGKDRAVVTRKLIDDKNAPAVLDTCGLFFNTVNTPKNISCTIIPDSSSKYNGQPFRLLLKNYDNNAGEYSFVLNKGRQRDILIKKEKIRGYLSLFFYNADTLVARQDIFLPEQNQVNVTLTHTKDSSYVFTIKDTAEWNYSIAVVSDTSADDQGTISDCLAPPGLRWPTDTAFLTLNASLGMPSSKHARNRSKALAVILQNDTVKETHIVPVDDKGNISMSGLYFFGTTTMHYELNGQGAGGRSDTLQLKPSTYAYPPFNKPNEDSVEADTLKHITAAADPDFDTARYMAAAIVMPRWTDRFKWMDTRYTTGRFSNPARLVFDLIHTDLKYTYDVMDFLKKQLPGFSGGSFNDTPKYAGKPVVFYLDQQLMNWRVIPPNLQGLAYVKVFEDFVEDDRNIRQVSDIPDDVFPTLNNPTGVDNTPRAMICLYTRKDKDFQSLPGQMNTLAIQGYDRPVIWDRPDRTTLLWAPYIDKHVYPFSVADAEGTPFKGVVEGVSRGGDTLHFEQVVGRGRTSTETAGIP